MLAPFCYSLLLLPLTVGLLGCSEESTFSDTGQRNTVESFSKAVFKGNSKLAFDLLSKKDQDLIVHPIAENQALARFVGEEPWKLLSIVDATNPYDIKAIEPKESFTSAPQEGRVVDVDVVRYNGAPQRYRLVWQQGAWKIKLQ